MTIQKHYSIRQAAKLIGISRNTLRRWLETDLGFRMPQVAQGSKILLSEMQLEAVLKKHSPAVDWNLLRRSKVA
ncbi:MAG TPA: helix-turn-helix domain-containing protein [Candidatus Acidoferrum sp.]|jgi:excisionase family DNA binding protein